MFKKKPNIKPLSPLRSSDRRKLADQIISDLGLPLPHTPAEDAPPEVKADSISKVTALRNAILPENAQSARFTTTHGPELKQVSGTVYVGTHEGGDQRVLWVKVGDQLWPTVYTLWQIPRIVPLLHTHQPVISKLQSGADLMVPGLANGPPFPSKAKKGAIVAVASLDNPSVPVVVGLCNIDVNLLGRVQGEKGNAVETLSWVGDEIWSWNPAGKSGIDPPESIEAWLQVDDVDVEETTQVLEGVSIENSKVATQTPKRSGNGASFDIDGDQETSNQKQWSTPEIDDAFYKAFLYGLNQSKDTGSPPRYGIEFPLRPSFIMSNLIQPFLPIFSSADAEALQIKKTSWKTMKKFLKTLDKKKPPFCWTKDQGGETNIFMIDFEHVEVDNFQRYSLPKKSKDTPQGSKSSGMATSDADPSVGQKLKIQVLYKAKEKHAALFSGADEARAYHSATHVKDAVAQYLERERLASATNKRLITLNPFLANSVIDGTKPTDRDAIARGTVPRDVLTERILSSCSPYHIILRNTSGSDSSAKPKAGNAPRVTIVLETRSGNKTVTKVSGLEAYFIPPQPLADELRKACAGSTSVDQLVGSSAKTPVMEVMVQGPQSQIILAALEKRGVDKRWIDLVDKTKKKK